MNNEVLPAAVSTGPDAGGRWLAWLALLGVLVTVVAGALWLKKVYEPAVREAADAFASGDRSLVGLSSEVKALNTKLGELTQAQSSAEARIAALTNELNKAITQLKSPATGSILEFQIARLDNLVAIADESIGLAHDPKRADAALQAVLEITKQMAGDEATALVHAVNDDRAALAASTQPDINALLDHWRDLANAIPALPAKVAAPNETTPQVSDDQAASTIDRVWSTMWNDIKGLIEIHDRTPADQTMLNPQQTQTARMVLIQDLAALRVATLLRDTHESRAQSEAVLVLLKENFAVDDVRIARSVAALNLMATLDLAPALPAMTATQRALEVLKRATSRPTTSAPDLTAQ